jgi:hypothetical protein
MSIQPTGKAIAQALGLSAGRISQLRRDGMPVDSIEAARAWYARRVDLGRSYGQRVRAARPAGGAALNRVVGLAARAEVALVAGRFGEVEAELRAALADVPPGRRGAVELSTAVWDALVGDVAAVLREFAEPADLPSDDLSTMASFWYEAAAGAVRRA